MLGSSLIGRLRVTLLRTYVFCAWNVTLLYQILTRRRESWIGIKNLRLMYDNAGLVIINKHPELLINHTSPFVYCVTLQMQLFYNRPHYANWDLDNMFHFINRLDYPTSGLICITHEQAATNLVGRAFNKGRVGKQYLAIVWGHVRTELAPGSDLDLGPDTELVSPSIWRVQIPIGSITHTWPNGSRQKIMAPQTYPDCRRPRKSCTLAVVLEHGFLLGQAATRLLLLPQTGRRHQLRLHCAVGLGHPIAGDLIYAKNPLSNHPSISYPSQVPEHDIQLDYKLNRMMLHAYHIRLQLQAKPTTTKSNKAHNHGSVLPEEIDICTGEDLAFSSIWRVSRTVNKLSDWHDKFDLSS